MTTPARLQAMLLGAAAVGTGPVLAIARDLAALANDAGRAVRTAAVHIRLPNGGIPAVVRARRRWDTDALGPPLLIRPRVLAEMVLDAI